MRQSHRAKYCLRVRTILRIGLSAGKGVVKAFMAWSVLGQSALPSFDPRHRRQGRRMDPAWTPVLASRMNTTATSIGNIEQAAERDLIWTFWLRYGGFQRDDHPAVVRNATAYLTL